MADELTPAVIDVPISTLSQTPPDHAGPIGRLVAMKNAEVKQYLPPQAGAAGGGSSPQAVLVQQREGFVSLTNEQHDSTDGDQLFDPFPKAELLATLGDQLVSIGDSVPRVYNGATWTSYGDAGGGDFPGARVLTGKLSESTLHTSNKTIQACDSAVINGITCFVWTETNEGLTASYVGFRSSEGAWVVTPRVLRAMTIASDHALAKVVSDGTRFWVFYNFENAEVTKRIHVSVYDTHGSVLSTAVKDRNWTTSPGFWDVVATPSGKVLLAQPSQYDPGDEHGLEFTKFSFTGPSTITQSSHVDATTRSLGPVAWLTNDIPGFSAFSYVATIGDGGEDALDIIVYEVDEATLTQTHGYLVTNVGSGVTIDSMTGYLISSSGIGVVVAVSFLSEYSPASGPPNDPGLRSVRVYACTRGGVQVFIKQANGVILQSRAFRIATSPPASTDYVAVTYYQSGGGLLPEQTAQTITLDPTDTMTGQLDQELTVSVGDQYTGAPHEIDLSESNLVPTQAIATITHNAGDSAVAATATWTLLNASFNPEAPSAPTSISSYLRITGSAIAHNNQDYLILQRVSATVVVTEPVGTAGFAMQDDTLAGVTASLISTIRVIRPGQFAKDFGTNNPLRPDVFPPAMVGQFIGGTLGFSGMANSGNNTTWTIKRVLFNQPAPSGTLPPYFILNTFFILTKTGSPVLEGIPPGAHATLTPLFPYAWIFGHDTFDGPYVGDDLVVEGAADGNNGTFAITSTFTSVLFTAGQPTLLPQVVAEPVPKLTVHLSTAPLTFTFDLFSFDGSYNGAFLTISGAAHPENNGTYVIQVISEHVVVGVSATGATGQRSENFAGGVTVTVARSTNNSPAYQPCWFLTPLSVSQQTVGRFEYGIAYADWRLDGTTTDAAIGVDFNRNNFPFALSSVAYAPGLTDREVVLPYRALSFTAGQVVRSGPNVVGIAAVDQSTVGLRQFTLAGASFGQAFANSGELLLPGPMAASFTASGFHENCVNVGPEQPFLVSQSATADIVGLTLHQSYQYAVVFEVMDENGDRTFSIPSPVLDVQLSGTNNTITLGGRMPGPTNRTLVGIAIYRTSVQGGVPTTQHYKITDDLDVNGAGFTFGNVNGGGSPDTWQFVDTVPDASILSSEILYTDKGLTPRFPAPAFSQGVGSWCNRTWVVGYDGAVWMSGEKTEGDAVWFTPLFRYVLPTEDKPVAIAPMDEFMLVFCSRTVWYIPKTDFISATLQSGSLPTPVQLPYQNGCTGWALTIRGGVAYSSSAGGVWMITRQLTNVWLSQDVQTDLLGHVTSLLVDEKQRFFVFVGTSDAFMFDQVSQCWSRWVLPLSAALACAWQGHATYQDLASPSNVAVHTPNVFADTINGVTTGAPPDVTLAGVSMAGVRSFKRCWAIQIVGQYKGPHRLNVVTSYPDEDGQTPTTYPPFTPDPTAPYVYEVNPDPEEASTFTLRIFADFVGVGTPGNSFALELVSFEVGVESGIGRLPPPKRIPSG